MKWVLYYRGTEMNKRRNAQKKGCSIELNLESHLDRDACCACSWMECSEKNKTWINFLFWRPSLSTLAAELRPFHTNILVHSLREESVPLLAVGLGMITTRARAENGTIFCQRAKKCVHEKAFVLKTHQADFGVPVRASYLHDTGDSDGNSKTGLMCFDH